MSVLCTASASSNGKSLADPSLTLHSRACCHISQASAICLTEAPILQCLVLLSLLLTRPASSETETWPQSSVRLQEAEQQLQANEHAWAPPGTFAAALSTFTAALQDADQTTDGLKQVCSSLCTFFHKLVQHLSFHTMLQKLLPELVGTLLELQCSIVLKCQHQQV